MKKPKAKSVKLLLTAKVVVEPPDKALAKAVLDEIHECPMVFSGVRST